MQLEPLVSAKWLKKNLQEVVVIDGSYYLPTMEKNADSEYEAGHIPGALRWDIDKIADTESDLMHMMPEPQMVADEAAARGISHSTPVVIYDQLGMFSAARVWLTFRSIGHRNVALLNGGLPAWSGELEEGVASAVDAVDYGDFKSVATTTDRHVVLDMLVEERGQVLDARSAERFFGTAAEPREGLLGGHMPVSVSLPYTELLNDAGQFKSKAVLKSVFAEAGVDLNGPLITSCGSGVTASITTFALSMIGVESLVYDGSWSEWGRPELEMPIVNESAKS